MTMREFDPGADIELTEYLAQMESHGGAAEVHSGRDLAVVQPLGGQFGHGVLGLGQALPSAVGPAGRLRPVTASHPKLAQAALEDYRDDVVLVVRVQHFELDDPTG